MQPLFRRIVAAALSDSLGVPVIVDAKPGAGGNIASEFVSRATPDGYTIILLTGDHAVSAALYRKLRFHPVDSFDFISLVGTFPFVVATRADGPIASLADVIATARQQPGKLSFISVGFGSTQQLNGELLALSTGGKLTHVPYRGGMQPLVDVLAGQMRRSLWPIDRLVIFYFEPLRPARYSTIGPTSSAATGAL